MIIKKAEYLISNTEIKKCPAPVKHEYAFIGRSNVGKSSLINMLTDRKGLAMTSAKPGKTKTINHFFIDDKWYLVDLPGYGYAKVSKTTKEKWDKIIDHYILKRSNLICTFVLIDSRLEPQKIDMAFMEWLGMNHIPFVIVFTKIDKLSSSELNKNLTAYKKRLLLTWESLPEIFISSAETGTGKKEILNYIGQLNKDVPLSAFIEPK
ncbi:MAG: YihA family ribosome biogenesis GTP-binding protein [Bacteroidetes bacterium RIFOXYA12_FULL_35_11]|nr:MAG: YihA family ribosome biogenesis GTP-binding protein [Bacteroidetes bacterium GWF2_35_48]OFY76748.1 MAG: YihA family ribosome biogenesis GTP-binding protein [Bacteroidetes bacterium RIFOXYA12_FULL_35_11]OFY96250.1 MAG: YihA family ribosome biogenesis GTP-binding protein [Bacteroidetes bacterium RIFOXYB2_FULL_35_7]HBX52345.1 YihA family ribosome biogenesis GTP-binding protein [Bacteroidales bacterium]